MIYQNSNFLSLGVLMVSAPTMISRRFDAQVGLLMVVQRLRKPTVTNRGGFLLTEDIQDPVEIALEKMMQSFTLRISLHEVI